MRLKSIGRTLSSILGLVIFGLVLWSLSVELRGYDLGDVLEGMSGIAAHQNLRAFLFTGMSYVAVSNYDVISFRYIGSALATYKIALVGLITYGISPTVGFPFLTGAALRYRLYSSWGISAAQIAQVIVFSNFSLWVGLFSVAGLVLFLSPSPIPAEIDFPFHSFQPLGAICLVLTLIYLLLCTLTTTPIQFRSYAIGFPSLRIALAQILTFAVDWGFASAVLYTLFSFSSSFSYLNFFGAYVIAMVAGLISTVPGGFGVLETILIYFLSPFFSQPVILGKILVFRVIYYLVPLGIAMILLGGFEIYDRFMAADPEPAPELPGDRRC